MKRALVTGSAGFIGRHLVEALGRLGVVVVPYDKKYAQSTLDMQQLRRYAKDCDVIFHLAGEANAADAQTRGSKHVTEELGSMINLIECNTKMVYVSSGYVYGNPQCSPIPESHPCNPTTIYGIAKYASEILASNNVSNSVIARLFNVYGQHQRSGFLIPDLIERAKTASARKLELRGNPYEIRDFTFVKDAVQALVILASAEPGAYNVGTGSAVMVGQVADLIAKRAGIRFDWPPQIVPKAVFHLQTGEWQPNYPYIADASKLRELGWKPTTTLEEGLWRTMEEDA